ncbi:MAG: GtrA family protein [Patescibacteria group bacterium]
MKKLLAKHPNFIQFTKFCIVGASGAAVDFGIYTLLRKVVGMNEIPATAISVPLAILNNFIWNKYWTFKRGKSQQSYQESVKFFVVSMINYFIHLAIFKGLLDYTSIKQLLSNNGDYLAKTIAIGVVMISNYIGNKYWTFRIKS